MITRIRLTRLGVPRDADSIEPSCGVMDVRLGDRDYRIVVDCGLIPVRDVVPEGQAAWHVGDLSFFQDGKEIDAVCITHVHGDHAGYLPALAPYLSVNAKIWMTAPSNAMIGKVLAEGLLVPTMHGGPAPFTAEQIIDVSCRIRRRFQPGPFEILPGITAYVQPEGHIPGACSFTFRIGGKVVHFSGDRCSHGQPGIRGASLLPAEWRPNVIANSDCTYGADPDSDRRSWREEMDRGLALSAETLRKGAPVLAFSFGIHRGGVMTHEMRRHGIPDIAPVYLDGSCRHFTEIVMSSFGRWSESDTLLDLDGVRWINREENSRVEVAKLGAYAVVSTPGMGGPGGAATFWRRYILPNPDALVLFTGYVAPGTDGDRILKVDAERRRTGEQNPVMQFETREKDGVIGMESIRFRCQVAQIRVGSHDSRGKIVQWFEGYAPEAAVLCHGSSAAMDSLETELQGSIPMIVRGHGQKTFEFDF